MRFLRFLVVGWLFLVGLALSPLIKAQTVTSPPERITSFESRIEILPDTSLDITERLTYTTMEPHHGIYRYIPTELITDQDQRRFRITVLSITNENGHKYQYEENYDNHNLTLKIGDPDTTFTGERQYVIHYRVDHVIDHLNEYEQLYWDITGEGWSFPIDEAKLELISPQAAISSVQCFTGPYGSNAQDCETIAQTDTEYLVTTTKSLRPGDNFTILALLNSDNSLTFPSTLEKQGFTWWIWPLFLIIPLPGIIMLGLWWRRGRDWVALTPHVMIKSESQTHRLRGILERFQAPFVYEPFTDLTPVEVEAIQKESISTKSLVAEILDLARKKYLKIETNEKKKLFGKETKYTFTKLKGEAGLNAHQAYLLQQLFKKGETVKLEELKGSFYSSVETWKKKVWDTVTNQGYFTAAPGKTRVKYLLIALALVLAAWAAWILIEIRLLTSLPWLLLVLVSSSLIALFMWYFMPQKSVEGWRVQQLATGLKKTIQRGKWREEIKEKHLFIEEVFPFAVSMGVVNKLAKDIDAIGEQPPDYIGGRGFTGAHLVNFSNSFVSSASSSLTYNPSSSSGGSGGGGFSGGGGGGGGGGSW